MQTSVHRLIYCSHCEIQATDAALGAGLLNILATSRTKNTKVGLTGALLYHGGEFAQVLEGPRDAIYRVMEAIHRDPRNSHITIALDEPAEGRLFPKWSMGFACHRKTEELSDATAALDAVFAKQDCAGEVMLGVMRQFVMDEVDRFL